MPTGAVRRTFATILIAGLLLCGSGLFAAEKSAGKDAEEPKTLREKIDREVLRFRMQLINGKMRLNRGIIGMNEIEGEPTPFRLCCSSNVGIMNGAVDELHRLFDELNACYDRNNISGGRAGVEFARSDLQQFTTGLERMEQTPEKRVAEMFMGGMTRAFLLLFESVEGLTPCEAPDASAGSKKKRKKGREKKKSD